MTGRLQIDFTPAEGAVVRMLGLVERRGFDLRAVAMNEADGLGSMTLDVAARDPGRRLDTLGLQLRRLVEVRDVAVVPS